MDSKNYEEYHEHPLVLLNQEQLTEIQSREACCSRCGLDVSGLSCFGCAEDCGFYLDKVCADAPSELNHPFHPHHPLLLSETPQTISNCHFCNMRRVRDGRLSVRAGYGTYGYVYFCSCGLNLHVRCALFTFNIAQKNFKELEHVALEDPPVPPSVFPYIKKYAGYCFFCRVDVESRTHFSPDCGFNIHKKCVELPLNLNHKCHRKHPLLLQFNTQKLSCKICQAINQSTILYVCSPCKFAVHIECVSPPPTFEHETHPHPFNLILSQGSFICDACGTRGDHVGYTCLTCNILVHKECLSLPGVIKSKWHDHPVSHKYFFYREYFDSSDCIICHDEVNTDYGNYCCKSCSVIIHAKCTTKDKDSYYILSDDEESLGIYVSSFTLIESNDAGEATVIEHCKHIGHHLMLCDGGSEHDNKCCDGCMLPLLSASFYYCSASECDFILHKVCAQSPKVKDIWHHRCHQPSVLISDQLFGCLKCDCISNAFGYMCERCGLSTCLRCVIALTPGARTHPGHKHPLFFYPEYMGDCNACGAYTNKGLFRCKECDFCLDHKCFSLPITARHKCDAHRLSLTYRDDNSYSESHFCDVCEERRDPRPWFYRCATCDTCAHVDCVIDGDHSFLKIGRIIDPRRFHRHPLVFVNNVYYYPNCSRCDRPCVDFALQCEEPGCNYIRHFRCP